MIDLFPFAGFPVAVLGLGPAGLATARALMLSGAEVLAWDEDAVRRDAAGEVPLRDLGELDWREPVSLVIEHAIPHGVSAPHPLVAKARAAGCEVIADSELLARAQRDALYVAVVSRRAAARALDLFAHVFSVSGRETEVGGDDARPILNLYPLEHGGIYVLDMPPSRAELTLSITFDAAVYLDLGEGAWPPCPTREATIEASRWVFNRQVGTMGAIVNVDDAEGRRIYQELAAKAEQMVIPISARSRAANGVYVADGILYDDITGRAEAVTDLDLGAGSDAPQEGVVVGGCLCRRGGGRYSAPRRHGEPAQRVYRMSGPKTASHFAGVCSRLRPMTMPFPLPEQLSPTLQRVYAYWDGLKRGGNDVPFWDDVSLSAMPDIGERLFLIDVFANPERFRFNAAGKMLTAQGAARRQIYRRDRHAGTAAVSARAGKRSGGGPQADLLPPRGARGRARPLPG